MLLKVSNLWMNTMAHCHMEQTSEAMKRTKEVMCLIKRRLENYLFYFVNDDEHNHFIWLKIMISNDTLPLYLDDTFLIVIPTFMCFWI